MTADEIKALAAERALDVCKWLFPYGWKEKAEWLIPMDGATDPVRVPVLSVNVGLRPGTWKDLVSGRTGADLADLYAVYFGAPPVASIEAMADFLGVEMDRPEPPREEPPMERDPHPADLLPQQSKSSKKEPEKYKLLPSAIEAEKGVISCLLQSPVTIGAICSKRGLVSGHFYTPAHAEIYDHMLFLWGERMECDTVTVITHFHSNGRLDAIGGAAYLSELFTYSPSLHNVGQYITLLEQKKVARDLIALTSEYQTRAYQETGEDVSDLVRDFQEKAAEINQGRGHERLPPMDSLSSWQEESDLPPEPPQVIMGLLHQGSKLIIAAPSKGRKSWTLLDMAACVSNGAHWWGIPTAKGRVAYLNFEVQKFAIARRLRWICKSAGLDMTDNLQVMTLRGITSPIEQLTDDLISYFLNRPAFSLIVVDPVFKLMAGRDENKVGDVMIILQNLERIAVRTGAAIAIAHHYSKGNQAGKESIDRMGGSGAFARDPDAILMMTSHEEEECFTVEPTLRNFAPIKPFVIRWTAPVFQRAPDLHPEDLKQPKKPGQRANSSIDTAKEKLGPMFGSRKIVKQTEAIMALDKQASRSGVKKWLKELYDGGFIDRVTVPREGYQATDKWEGLA